MTSSTTVETCTTESDADQEDNMLIQDRHEATNLIYNETMALETPKKRSRGRPRKGSTLRENQSIYSSVIKTIAVMHLKFSDPRT